MQQATELKKQLQSIHRKSYPAYKSLKGSYQFGHYILSIDHVQGDPFASPSHISVHISRKDAGFPDAYSKNNLTCITLADHLTRQFEQQINHYSFRAKGSGKSGLISVSHCGQEILSRTACEITSKGITARFFIGFPANGRTINAPELEKILFVYLPKCVEMSLYHRKVPERETEQVICLKEDQRVIREELKKRGLIAFVANGSILPRQSGNSDLPMKDAVPFQSPKSMEITIQLRHRGSITGMGIRKGITLIAGGGYHGKSTLLEALEKGVYDHIAGDGREYVITSDTAMKIRAEDGRWVSHINISPFINDLPNKKDTVNFFTEDASGSTSQAANVVEAVQSGAKCLLIDEDTCATNFMVRDELMQAVVSGEQEPITPFTLQAGNLYQKQGISIILVAGSSGSYFYIADHVLQMDNYRTYDITEKVKTVIGEKSETREKKVPVDVAVLFDKDHHRSLKAGKMEKKRDQVKIKQFGKDSFSIGRENVDLKYVEQILDAEQTTALAYCLKNLLEEMERKEQDVDLCVEKLWSQIKKQGLASLCKGSYLSVAMAQIRKQDIYACLNRYRGFIR